MMITIEGAEDKGNCQNPILRIYVLGPLDIQWPNMNIPFPKERLQGRGAAPALGLLKVCISRPDRFALRDWLMEQFWPESARSRADERLDDVASGLRGLLRPPRSTAKILHFVYGKDGKGNGYRLSDYPQIWVDADAFEYYVSQAARLDRFGHNSLSLWEHAYQLGSRGEFLPDERYSDWAQSRRERLQGQYRQCVHRVVQCLREIGAYEEALLRERRYWQGNKTDEDALRPLLEMLGERERYQEAETYYEQARETVKLEDRDLDEKTRDVMEYLRAQPIQRERAIQQAVSAMTYVYPVHRAQGNIPYLISSPFSQTITQGIIETSVSGPEVQHTSSILSAVDCDSNLTQQPTTAWTHQERVYFSLSPEQMELLLALGRGDSTMLSDPSKRDALQRIAALVLAASGSSITGSFATLDLEPWDRLFMAQRASSPSTILNAATLEYFKQLLTTSWQLCDGNQLDTAEGVLAGFLPKLLSLPIQEPDTAFLISHGLRLHSVLAHHHLRLIDKVHLCEKSVSYARQAGNMNTLATALLELVWAYKYAQQPEKCSAPLQELLAISLQVSPLVRSRIYSRYAVVLAESGRMREAEFYIGLAEEVLPDNPVSDPGFALTDSSVFFFSYCAGLVCIHTGSITKAFEAFEYYKQHPSALSVPFPERNRLEIANGQSRAAILDNDAERYADLLENVLVGSVRIRSQKRFDEALVLFREDMPAAWLSIDRIKQLVEQYGLKREK
jgi:DNA-binding SARP family transcriptional activator